MLNRFVDAFKSKDVRGRIFFTLSILLIYVLGLLIAVLFLIPKDTYSKIFGKDNNQDNNINVSGEPVLVYMCNDKDLIVGVNAYNLYWNYS